MELVSCFVDAELRRSRTQERATASDLSLMLIPFFSSLLYDCKIQCHKGTRCHIWRAGDFCRPSYSGKYQRNGNQDVEKLLKVVFAEEILKNERPLDNGPPLQRGCGA